MGFSVYFNGGMFGHFQTQEMAQNFVAEPWLDKPVGVGEIVEEIVSRPVTLRENTVGGVDVIDHEGDVMYSLNSSYLEPFREGRLQVVDGDIANPMHGEVYIL